MGIAAHFFRQSAHAYRCTAILRNVFALLLQEQRGITQVGRCARPKPYLSNWSNYVDVRTLQNGKEPIGKYRENVHNSVFSQRVGRTARQ